ncbi:OLC1v1022268C1 [Oldenlandia corymbosa var. corymbosa]|uniref:OLC1v1022268C1 n=1 Tax=Oldenlandia corymbosa var. corymbosa TaxID=529605 RepID=A0AAV1BXH2_OLDCO|nr:OLC1v1022268C1 [Oldenlandia corymbosa var. corymbosa]
MAVSFKYWDDCVDLEDLEAMWADPDVRAEWLNAGEAIGSKIHLSRDPDGQPYLTQTEIKAVAGIIVRRHFVSQIDSDMLCAIATLESDRQPLATQYNKKSKETMLGIMQILPKTAEWLARDLGYRNYDFSGNQKHLYKPFVNVYFGAAYLKWLSTYDQKDRSEEFMVRAYKGGTKKATHKSTLQYWKRYISVKESLPSRKVFEVTALPTASSATTPAVATAKAPVNTTWDSRTSKEDMEEMWNNASVSKEWTKSGEKKGKVRFSHDVEKRPYLSRVELRGVSEIILAKHFSTRRVKPAVLCALSEMVSMRFVDGVGQRVGLMGIDYPTARWLYKDVGCKVYKVESVEDLTKPFVSMYFGAAYLAWLSEYEGRERTPQFIVQAYLTGPQKVNHPETGPLWLKFEEALSRYEDFKKEHEEGSCTIL